MGVGMDQMGDEEITDTMEEVLMAMHTDAVCKKNYQEFEFISFLYDMNFFFSKRRQKKGKEVGEKYYSSFLLSLG